MAEMTPGADLIFRVTCTPSISVFDGLKDLSICALSGFNTSNSSEARLRSENMKERNVSVEVEEGTNPLDWEHLWRGIPLGIVLTCLCLLTTVGNIMVLHAVRTEKRLQTVSNLFIVSLAVADVIVGIIVMPMSAFYIFTERWMLGVAVCQIWMGVDYTASTASILNLFILSLDRYWSVRQPLKYLHKRTKRRALSMIGFVWVVSSLWIIPISSWHYFAHGGIRTVPGDKCDTEYAKNSFFKIITAFFNFYLPLTVMYILYLRIFIAIRKRSEFELGQRNPGGTVLSYKSNIANSHSVDESECIDDLSTSMEQRLGGTGRTLENGARSYIPTSGRNLRVLTVKRQHRSSAFNEDNSDLYKVEYIYDENVIDPQTEKIERYYYEDHYPVSRLPRTTWMVGNEKFSVTNQRQGLFRSPRPLGDFKLSSEFHSMSSLTTCSFKSSGPHFREHDKIPHELMPKNIHSLAGKRSVFRPQKKRNKSVPKVHDNVQLENSKKYKPDGSSFSPSVCLEQTRVSSSSSSSSCTFEGKRVDGRGIRIHHDPELTNNGLDVENRRSACSERLSRANISSQGKPRDNTSALSRSRHMRYEGSVGLASSSSMDGSLYRHGDDAESALDMQDDENRSFTNVKAGLKERMGTIRQSSSLNKEIKAAKQLGVIMGAFTLCFLPYFILFLVVAFCDNCIKPGPLTAATWIGYLNSTLNPFLYPLCNINFRNKFRSMLACSRNRRSPLRVTQTDYLERNTHVQCRYD